MKELNSRDIRRFLDLINASRNILITTHANADGDAIGSSLALALVLEKTGKKIDIITPDDYPSYLKWMKGSRLIHVYDEDEELCRSIADLSDMILAIDYNDPKRLKEASGLITSSDKPVVLIDHHPDPVNFANITFSETDLGSSAELIYYIIREIGLMKYMNRDVAEALFTGIMTDTGCFNYSCSYPEVFQVTAELLKYGIDKDNIYRLVYDNYSADRMRLMGYCMYKKMTIIEPYHTAIIRLTKDELKKFNHITGDTEGFVNLPFSVKGIMLTALFIEKEDHVKISFRSKNNFSVNEFSAKHFRGGGHMNAAGGEWDLPLDNAVQRFIDLLETCKDILK